MKVADESLRQRLARPQGSWHSEEGLRDSAVLALLVERDGSDGLLFHRRRDDLPYHAGQICFPGGAREGDEDAVACALRETEEEMGIAPRGVALLGRLPDRVSIAGFKVACFVGRMPEAAPYRLEEREVAEAFEIPCAALLEEGRWSRRETSHPLARFKQVPVFTYGPRIVWGLTGILLHDFVQSLAPGFRP